MADGTRTRILKVLRGKRSRGATVAELTELVNQSVTGHRLADSAIRQSLRRAEKDRQVRKATVDGRGVVWYAGGEG